MKRSKSVSTRTRKLVVVIIFNQSTQKMDIVFHSIRVIRKIITKSEYDT